MLKELLYQAVDWIAMVHEKIIRLNDQYEGVLSDKQLHFLVIGALGLLLIFLIHPIFLHFTKTDHVMIVSWIYVFTLILVITFAIEIGQRMTDTGEMDFADIVFGVGGFIALFALFAVFRGIAHGFAKLAQRRKEKKNRELVQQTHRRSPGRTAVSAQP